MFSEGIYPIGDGLLDVDEERLKGLLVQDDINEFYDVEQTPFARGKFAAVRRAIHKKSGVHFAAKFLKRRRRAQSSDKEIKHEIAVLMLCSGSDNIVKLNAVHESRSDTALLLELATGGELQALLDNEGSLTEAQTRICMREVLKALQFLHKRSIAHLDLKPQNILLNGERVEDGLKLCDFGISRVVEVGSKVREILGTPDYVAPEVLQYEPLSLLTDIWSVGVLTYVLLSGFSPFGGDTKQETFLNISQCALSFPDDLFDGVSDHALDFIRSTLRIKPNDRMTALECLDHIWLKDDCTMPRKFLNISTLASDDRYDETILDDEDDEDDDEEENDVNLVVVESQNRSSTISSSSLKQKVTPNNANDDCNKENHPQKQTVAVNQPQETITTSVNICLFPDAPTTPKVIRKAPSSDSSPTSVKALVKKFQLESGEPLSAPGLLKESQANFADEKKTGSNGPDKFSHMSSISVSRSNCTVDNGSTTTAPATNGAAATTPTATSATYKTSCVFCLTCGGPGCRHSGNSVSSKATTNNLGLDQGIIC